MLRGCPQIAVLVTSREPLGVPGEVVLGVPPLSDDDAVSLFVDRARLVQPSFALDEANEAAIRSIAAHLDGIPLALELAAAWVRTLPPKQVEAALDEAFVLGAQRVVPVPVGGAFHTPFMASARPRLRKAIRAATFREPEVPVVANVDALAHATADDWQGLSSAQLCSPVRWRQSILRLAGLSGGFSGLTGMGAGTINGAAFKCDVGKEKDVSHVIEETEHQFGPIALFCSNAGIGGGFDPLSVNAGGNSDEPWQRSWAIHVMAHVYAARHLVPRYKARGGGYFLNTISAAGLLSLVGGALLAGAAAHAYRITTGHALAELEDDAALVAPLLAPEVVAPAVVVPAAVPVVEELPLPVHHDHGHEDHGLGRHEDEQHHHHDHGNGHHNGHGETRDARDDRDVVRLAEGFGCRGVRTGALDDLPGALAEAFAADRPTLIEVRG